MLVFMYINTNKLIDFTQIYAGYKFIQFVSQGK